MKKEFFVFILIIALISISSVSALSPCQAGGLTTSIHKDYQMMYTDKNFIQVDNKDLLKDLNQLNGLTCLQYLDAYDSGIKGDIANLKNLADLEVLSFHTNPDVYGDICSLSGATKLRSLKFAFDKRVYGDILCLKDINLDTFAMTNTKISGNLSSLSHMTNLKALYISGTNITGDISSLSQLVNLEELGISDEYPGNSQITGDLASLDNLTKLRKVSLYKMKTTNCTHFTEMHPDIEQGGCSQSSQASLRDTSKLYRKNATNETGTNSKAESQARENFSSRFFGWIKGLFKK